MMKIVKRNLHERSSEISNKLGIPKITVENVLIEYINSIHNSIDNGEDVTIDTIVSIKQKIIDDKKIVRCRLSKTIRERNK